MFLLPRRSLILIACAGVGLAGGARVLAQATPSAAGTEPAAGAGAASASPDAGAHHAPDAGGEQPIAWVPTEGVSIAGSLDVSNGRAAIANNGTVTAGERTAHISLARGGQIALCATTKVHLTRDSSLGNAETGALMLALDRGALEANYTTGQYSDVVMTPDLRILVSGPGEADLKLRVGANGDTCVDNHGANAPYVTVSSQFEDGLYRVQPNQRVSFQHGSLHSVVDNEAEPCGCPVSVASSGTTSAHPAKPGQPVGGPSSTPADTAFPLAQSEGLAPAPPPPTNPAVPAGQAHAEVTVPLVYNGGAPPAEPPPAPEAEAAKPAAAASSGPAETASAPAPQKQPSPGFFHKVGHFFAHIFGKG